VTDASIVPRGTISNRRGQPKIVPRGTIVNEGSRF
jgi:hypothetical protein